MTFKLPKNYVMRYVIYTFGLFILLLLTLGGIASKLLQGIPRVMDWLITITAWTPTYVFLLMFRKLYPGQTLQEFFRGAFRQKPNVWLLTATTLVQILIFATSVAIVATQQGVQTISLLDFSFPTIIPGLFFVLMQGPTGEETGWRGYLLPEVIKKHGVAKGCLWVSLVWSFWHAPVWFLGTEYSGIVLVKYIAAFVVSIASLGFIMGIFYYHCRNLLIPIWMHFIFNVFLGLIFAGSLVDLLVWVAAFYFVSAVAVFLWHKSGLDLFDIKRSKYIEETAA